MDELKFTPFLSNIGLGYFDQLYSFNENPRFIY